MGSVKGFVSFFRKVLRNYWKHEQRAAESDFLPKKCLNGIQSSCLNIAYRQLFPGRLQETLLSFPLIAVLKLGEIGLEDAR